MNPIDDIIKMLDDMSKDLGMDTSLSDIINKMGASSPDIKIEGFTRDENGNINKMDMSKILRTFYPQPSIQEQEEKANIDHNKKLYEKIHCHNILVITKILEMCKEKTHINEIMWSKKYSKEANDLILAKNNFTDELAINCFDMYSINLSAIKNINKFLIAMHYACKKEEIKYWNIV